MASCLDYSSPEQKEELLISQHQCRSLAIFFFISRGFGDSSLNVSLQLCTFLPRVADSPFIVQRMFLFHTASPSKSSGLIQGVRNAAAAVTPAALISVPLRN